MRPTLLALLASVAIASATGCAQSNIDELAARTTCGHSKTISKCLRSDIDLTRLDEIEQCFIAGGCEIADAIAEAVSFAFECRASEHELKKRANSKNATTKTTPTISSAEAITTSDSTTSTIDSTTASSTTGSTAAATTGTSSSTDSTGTATTSTSLQCSVTSTVPTMFCSVSGRQTISCYSTTTAIASCAPGVICFAPTAGVDVCMRRDDKLTMSGLIVTIALVAGIVAAIIAFVAVAIHGKSKLKAQERAKLLQSADSGRNYESANAFSGARSGRPVTSESHLPLVTPGGQRSDNYQVDQQEYFNQGQGQGQASGAPRLNPGLGALAQERY